MKSKSTKKKVNKNIVFQKIDGRLIGFDVDKSSLYTFNETAEYIYKKIKAGETDKKIVSLLIKKYAIDEKVARKDINDLKKDLKKNKILL